MDGTVKLVGPTISCEGSPLDGDQKGVWRRNPHVQSYVVATDRIGLQLLLDDRRVFQCHRRVRLRCALLLARAGASPPNTRSGVCIITLLWGITSPKWPPSICSVSAE